ncbi:MAG: HAD hydrolase-like protein [Clostridia bacterium]|nr:HAD hydrolase-like protein [Clostridia bacterium]
MPDLKSYIWDLDGTLLDSYGSIVSSLVSLSGECRCPDSPAEILKAVKHGSVSAYLSALSGRSSMEYEFLYSRYREISHGRVEEITLIPGALETLESLKSGGAQQFVYTHRGQSAWPLLSRLGLSRFFAEVVTFENGFRPKPSGEGVRYLVRKYSLDNASTAYVGDRTLDVACAKDADVLAILYLPQDSCVVPTGMEDRIISRLEELV